MVPSLLAYAASRISVTAKTRSLGVDIGQRVDPTTVVMAEAETQAVDGRAETIYRIRHLECLALGIGCPAGAEHIAAVAAGVVKKHGPCRHLYAGCTRVGRPVVDMLPPALGAIRVRCSLITLAS